MSGPIVRSGPSEKFSNNFAQAFGASGEEAPKATEKKAAKSKSAKTAKKAKKK